MNLRALSRIDLNLLVSLQVLLEERSVTRAAERLFVTQPAMSRVLQRLRNQFDDPLFTRKGNELVLSPKAKELQSLLPSVLGDIESLVIPGEFDPATYSGEIKIAVPEFLAIKIIPKLMSVLAEKAPNLSLAITGEVGELGIELGEGTIDFAIDIEKRYPKEIKSWPVGGFNPAICMRAGHPLAENETITLDEMLAYPFVQYYLLLSQSVSVRVDSRFDRVLSQIGRKRNKLFVTNQLMTAISVVNQTDCLMLATGDPFFSIKGSMSLVRKPYPATMPFDSFIKVNILQHSRTMSSPVHKWLMEQVQMLVASEGGADLRF